jgi:hypothetical protein
MAMTTDRDQSQLLGLIGITLAVVGVIAALVVCGISTKGAFIINGATVASCVAFQVLAIGCGLGARNTAVGRAAIFGPLALALAALATVPTFS